MKIEVRLIDGNHITFEAPQGFSLESFVHQIRSMGAWIAPSIYVPHENIFSIHVAGEGPKFAGRMQ